MNSNTLNRTITQFLEEESKEFRDEYISRLEHYEHNKEKVLAKLRITEEEIFSYKSDYFAQVRRHIIDNYYEDDNCYPGLSEEQLSDETTKHFVELVECECNLSDQLQQLDSQLVYFKEGSTVLSSFVQENSEEILHELELPLLDNYYLDDMLGRTNTNSYNILIKLQELINSGTPYDINVFEHTNGLSLNKVISNEGEVRYAVRCSTDFGIAESFTKYRANNTITSLCCDQIQEVKLTQITRDERHLFDIRRIPEVYNFTEDESTDFLRTTTQRGGNTQIKTDFTDDIITISLREASQLITEYFELCLE